MTLFKYLSIAVTCSMAAAVASTAVAQNDPSGHTALSNPTDSSAFTIDMKRGEVLQVIVSEQRPDGRDAARTYGQAAFPLAQRHGYQRIGQFNVRQTVRSDFKPQAVSFFSWPSQAALDAFSAEPAWPAIKATRPQAWTGLDIYSAELSEDLTIKADRNKHYTVLVAWLKSDEATADYDRYLAGIAPAVERSGGRFIYKMRMPEREAYAPDATAPHQLTFVEWESTDGFDRVQQSEEYLNFRKYFGSSVEKFEFYWMQTPQD